MDDKKEQLSVAKTQLSVAKTQLSVAKTQLELLLNLTIEGLITKLKSGNAKAQDFQNAIRLLKNNGIVCDVKSDNSLEELMRLSRQNLRMFE